MHDAFNANFYVVTATVNPIFFLALTIQGSFYGGLIDRINKGKSEAEKITNEQEIAKMWRAMRSQYAALGAWTLAIAILASGLGGEIVALFALYHQHASYDQQSFVLWSTVGIIALTAATPGWTVVRAYCNWEFTGLKFSIRAMRAATKEMRKTIKEGQSPCDGTEPGLTSESSTQTADEVDQFRKARRSSG